MSQAEHDRLASAILLTDCEELAKETETELEKQMTALSRKDIIRSSVDNFGAVIVCSDMSQAVEFANELAPEHLEVCCENPMEYVGKLDNAALYFSATTVPNLWATILQVLTMFFRQAARQDFSHLFR